MSAAPSSATAAVPPSSSAPPPDLPVNALFDRAVECLSRLVYQTKSCSECSSDDALAVTVAHLSTTAATNQCLSHKLQAISVLLRVLVLTLDQDPVDHVTHYKSVRRVLSVLTVLSTYDIVALAFEGGSVRGAAEPRLVTLLRNWEEVMASPGDDVTAHRAYATVLTDVTTIVEGWKARVLAHAQAVIEAFDHAGAGEEILMGDVVARDATGVPA